MATSAKYFFNASPNLPIGSVKLIQFNNLQDAPTVINSNGTWVATNNLYNQSDYPELYSQINVLNSYAYDNVNSTLTNTINSIIYANGLYVYGGTTSTISSSTDGINWVQAPSLLSWTGCLAYGNGLFVAGEGADRGSIGAGVSTSTDAVNWTYISFGSFYPQLFAMIYANGLFVTSGYSDQFQPVYLATSTNGTNWITGKQSGGTLTSVKCLAYGNGLYVYGGNGGTLYTSTDTNTLNWTARASGTSGDINSMVYANNLFVAVGTGGNVLTSTNAINWSVKVALSTSVLNSITYANGMYIAGGVNGYLITSTDASNWSRVGFGSSSTINSITYGNGLFLAGGTNGILRTSTDGLTPTTAFNPLANENYDIATKFYVPAFTATATFETINSSFSQPTYAIYIKAKL